ncbi:hypothetical protein DNH61_10555 [Paenibacillus sambharensis]|uniref:LysM domain-containing protein n=1 Tax=Paenibacillus sambharensis TaxID=1803190 RepID=A0A2W1LAY0_9BACL|nr:M23 family metallopeptidase [Paenibacillus sambharensis]PZD95879.1 hypothetical protein DNH61_10555 [Paenibacillus sambharensis]
MKFKTGILGVTAGLLLMAGTAQGASYTVLPGDSLWKISLKYETTVTDLVQRNQLTSDALYPGQVLDVPGPSAHIVHNETMWLISQKYGITLDALIKANPQISNPNNIWNGLTIWIPETKTAAPAVQPKPAQPAAYADGVFPLAKGTFQLPLVNNYNDGRSWTPTGEQLRKHDGVDIFAKQGTPIYSVLDGQIINYGWNEYGGWRVTIRVDSTTAFYYAHLSKYAPGLGMGVSVKKGQLLGYVGNTGYGPEGTSGKFDPHLHFGIYKTSPTWTSIDPFPYLKWWEQK